MKATTPWLLALSAWFARRRRRWRRRHLRAIGGGRLRAPLDRALQPVREPGEPRLLRTVGGSRRVNE